MIGITEFVFCMQIMRRMLKPRLRNILNSRLRGETFADVENVEKIKENDLGIIYQDYFKTE